MYRLREWWAQCRRRIERAAGNTESVSCIREYFFLSFSFFQREGHKEIDYELKYDTPLRELHTESSSIWIAFRFWARVRQQFSNDKTGDMREGTGGGGGVGGGVGRDPSCPFLY